jgi:2-octaprenyl-6-methoxyphenol hydroxylase
MKYDIVIVGGGMVGATLAIALQKKQRILLIDASPLNLQEDHRLIALNHTSVNLFKNLHLWEHIRAHATPITQIHVSKRGNFGVTRICAHILDLSALGYVVPAKYINAALNVKNSSIDILRPATLKNLRESDEGVILDVATVEGDKVFTADCVIGADGSHSSVREILKIPTKKIDYEQSALVTVTTLARSHENIAYERFLEDGAIAMLPLKNLEVATIWTGTNTCIEELMAYADEDFLKILQKTFGYRLGRMLQVGRRFTYPLQFIKASQNQKGRVFLMGNALHTLSPIAAQGFNLALYEIGVLADHLEKHHELKNVEFSQHFSEQLSHHLTWIFSSHFFLFNFARQAAMITLDVLPTPKKYFTEYAMGRHQPLPALLRSTDEN